MKQHPSARPATDDLAPPPQTEAIRTLLRVVRRHHACIERHISDMGIHHSQHRMLLHLSRCEQIPSQKELAEAMGISAAAVATTLKRLEKGGYIARAVTDEDNRRNEIRITDLGRAKVLESREIFDSVDHAVFAGFSDEELSQLAALISRMDGNLDALGIPDPGPRPRPRDD